MGFSPTFIGILLINLALAYHSIRSGRSPLWLLALAVGSFMGFLVTVAIWVGYLAVAVLPDFWRSDNVRRLRGQMARAADPGRDYREAKRGVAQVGSVDSFRALAEESIKLGKHAEAVALYESAMAGPLGASDPALIRGLARAKMLSGDGAGAEALFAQLQQSDPTAFDADAELDYARALEAQGKNGEAVRSYEIVAARYPGEEARARYALLLLKTGDHARAQALFREILDSVKGAPAHYRRRQSEWVAIARQNIR